jgi:hypothetical protein
VYAKKVNRTFQQLGVVPNIGLAQEIAQPIVASGVMGAQPGLRS